MKRAHLQVTIWKAADKRTPPTAAADVSKFGWEVQGGLLSPAIHTGPPAPAPVMRELSRGCRSEQACVGEACGYQAKHITMHHIFQVYRTQCV